MTLNSPKKNFLKKSWMNAIASGVLIAAVSAMPAFAGDQGGKGPSGGDRGGKHDGGKHEHGAQMQDQARRDLCKLPSLQFHQR